ncbi:ATP-binding protein [Streptomyces sp. SID12501]|uniref:ATP-binding protein n=1 Tax=Streptomyces sp. SID12501 TaxID=2706042 RepID=A0A6B3BND8_9ACTN|nr:ATP-binding protein [Streptomyces sp. SID12501]
MFVRHTLAHWHFEKHIDTAALIMSELVTNAVRAGGIIDDQLKSGQITSEHVIGIQLRALETSLYVEVWDRTEAVPVRKNPGVEAVGGRGLLLVEALAEQWDIFRPIIGGKIVWAKLPLDVSIESGTHQQRPPLVLPPGIRASRGSGADQARSALLDQLLTTTITARTKRAA